MQFILVLGSEKPKSKLYSRNKRCFCPYRLRFQIESSQKYMNRIFTKLLKIPCSAFITEGDGRVNSLVIVLCGLEDEAEGSVLGVDKGLDPVAIGDELLLVEQPLDAGHGVAAHLALQFDGRAFDSLGRPS